MRRIAKITGRSDDMMIIRGVNVFPSQIEEHVLAVKQLSPHYQLDLSREGAMDVLRVRAEYKAELSADVVAVARAALSQRIKDFVGINVDVEVGEPGSVPRSEGKAARVIDAR